MKTTMYQVIGNERKLVYKDKNTHVTFLQEFLPESTRKKDDDGILYVDDSLMVFAILSKAKSKMGTLYLEVDQNDFSAEARTVLIKSFFRDSFVKKRILNSFLAMKLEYSLCDSVSGYAEIEARS